MNTIPPSTRFGRLVVIGPADPVPVIRQGKTRHWSASLCHCDCGHDAVVPNWRLKTGHVVSCGCMKHRGLDCVQRRKLPPAGAAFGHLTVVRPAPDRVDRRGVHHTQSVFRCDCGKLVVLDNSVVRRERNPSCGHDRKPRTRPSRHLLRIPRPGSVFGALTVVGGRIEWGAKPTVWSHVQCACGRLFDVWAESLKRGTIANCGECASKSHRETEPAHGNR